MANVDTNTLCSETDIVNMLEFLIDNIFAMFGRFYSTYANILENRYKKVRKNVGIGWIG